MKFTCENCSAHYMISDEKVGPSGVKVRCKKCGTVIHVRRPAEGAVAAASAQVATVAATAGGGLEAELGQAFDNAFGDAPARTPAPIPTPAPDLAATQTMGEEDAARIAAGSAPPATEWYVAIGQAQVGPLPLAEVKRKWEGGEVGPDSLVWRPGMGDWAALSTVPDLAGYLAPVPHASARAARPDARLDAAPVRGEPAPAGDVAWKPVAASALAALASEEIATHGAPAPKAEPRSAGGVQSLVDALPEGGGVDPTGAIPLPIKGFERTEEKKIERRSSVARGAEEARSRRSLSRAVVAGATVVGLLVAGGAAAFWYMNRQLDRAPTVASAAPAPQPVAAQPDAAKQPADPAPEPTPAPTPAPAAAPAPEGAVASAVQPPPAATAPGGTPSAGTPAPAQAPAAQPAPEKASEPQHSAALPPPRTVRREPPPRREPARETRVAKATPPAPTPEPTAPPAPRKKSVLDFESNDAALDEALGGGSPSSGRSVYVPPRPGGELPAKLSSAQINESVAQRIDGLQRCVSEQKARDADASGTLKMRWIIAGDGSVRDVKCLTPEYASGQFAQCLSGVVKTIKFPRSMTTGQEVTFPFKF
jgi:predicted Zn finger-like uncharacterized protein